MLNLESKRREEIINAALKEFAAKGFDDASTNVIAKEAGISKSLMFHYVNNKKDFFLFLYDYCLEIIKKEYFDLIDLDEKDIFERLSNTYMLKVKVLKKYPWIFDFTKVVVFTDSEDVKKELDERRKNLDEYSLMNFYGDIDISKFRDNLDVEKSKQLIYWAIGGYANKILEEIRSDENYVADYEKIGVEFNGYLDELRKSFYK
ncbi:MAG: TetR/AcrR family transcriptional regulator [Sedimentibacter saalensis]|uniref:TetR/AcrR family transcriptional regulator n=1 Tax=Sedimentibacter saalensis TaxID=130788 RepID=UPI002B20747D|nr:TetR/AcrR family transcriptional regulator [Sedimentibacter saalensis]MEA5094105.1 TetR/AcrR family transcriptional regulator [Sedimentibacter saalensis]